jgi:WD40 repeat protein
MVKIFDLDDNSNHLKRGKEIYCLANPHKKEITGLEVTQDSKYAVSTSTDGTLKIYELEENTLLLEKDFCYEDSKKNPENSFASYPKSKSPILIPKPNSKRSSFTNRNSQFSNLVIQADKYKFPVSSLSVSEDYKYIAVGFSNGDINILSFMELNIIYTIKNAHQSEVYSIKFYKQIYSEARMELYQRENEFFIFSLSKKGFKVFEITLKDPSEVSEGDDSLQHSQEI